MNILVTTPTFYPRNGGAENFLSDLLPQFKNSGHAVTVFTSLPSDSPEMPQDYRGIRIVRLPYPTNPINRWTRSFSILRRLWKIIRGDRIQVVIVGLVGMESIFVAILHHFLKFNLVVFLHGSELRSYVRISLPVRWALRQILRRCDAAIAVSQDLKREAIFFEPSVEKRIFMVPCGIDLEKIRNASSISGSHERYIFYVGRFHKIKDLPTVLAAFRDVSAVIPDLKLFLAGSGPEKETLEGIVSEYDLKDRIRFLGSLKREEVFQRIQGCEMFVLASASEGCPVTILEAFAARKPVIASRVTGIIEIVEDGKNGILFEYGDSRDLSGKIIGFFSNLSLKKRIETNLQNQDLSEYEVHNIARKHSAIYLANDRPLRICLISAGYGQDENCGGISTYYDQLNRSLVRLGHKIFMVTSSGNHRATVGNEIWIDPPWQNMISIPGSKGALKRLYLRFLFSYRAYRAARKLDRRHRLDLVVAPELFAQGFFVSLFMRDKLMTRIHAPTLLVDRWNKRPSIHGLRSLLSLPEKFQARRSLAITTATKFLARNIEDVWNIPARKIRILRTGMDVNWVRTIGMNGRREIPGRYVLYFGRLEPLKGVDVLSESLKSVFETDRDIKMIWIGRDWGSKAGILVNLSNFQDRMEFHDTMPKERLFPIVFHATLVVLPSLFENFSNAGLEAMALERAVIATRDTGFSEMIRDGVDGFLVESGNARELSAKILECIQRDDLMEIGKKAYESVLQFESERIAHLVVDMVQQVLQRQSRKETIRD